MAEINRKYKDSVFRVLFSEKDRLIELYNAIFDTDYTEDDSVDITTLEDVVFKTIGSRFLQIKTHYVRLSLEILA
ncbi:MAG: hypothetical protein SOT05_09510 [Anaerovoracaceae bacterium]|nr:hypothetical protein [Clostridiales bacterium]MDY2934310.1 hypothetical protein [Anaerovoracaceae bacterium]